MLGSLPPDWATRRRRSERPAWVQAAASSAAARGFIKGFRPKREDDFLSRKLARKFIAFRLRSAHNPEHLGGAIAVRTSSRAS